MFVRLIHKHASLDLPDARNFFDAEFLEDDGSHRELSVYKVEPNEFEEIVLQHHAVATLDPPRAKSVVDVTRLLAQRTVREYNDGGEFALRRERHHVVCFAHDDEVVAFCGELLGLAATSRTEVVHKISKEAFRLRLYRRLEAKDPEWTAFMQNRTDDWQRYPLAPKPTPPPPPTPPPRSSVS